MGHATGNDTPLAQLLLRDLPPGAVVIMRDIKAAFGILIALALLVMATVPQGMMRIRDEAGMRVVLCTSDGPQEIWLNPDGTPGQPPEHDHSAPHCVQVHIADVGIDSPTAAYSEIESRFSARIRSQDQIAARTPPVSQAGPRAPPAFV